MLKPYNEVKCSKTVEEKGSEQEGYEKILSYNIWLTLSKISLSRTETEYSDPFDLKDSFEYAQIFEFIEGCRESGMTHFEFDSETDSDGDLDECFIKGQRERSISKTKDQLLGEYRRYINDMNSKNQSIWRASNKDKEEYQTYLRLKSKYENR